MTVGAPRLEAEAWRLSGFIPRDAEEKRRLAEQRRALGCDPTTKSEDLRASHDDDPRSPKYVLDQLTDGDATRATDCLTESPLETLVKNGAGNGLRELVERVREVIVPSLVSRT
ncbi:MAG: hypothetical protein U0414_09620 [Polyangiaceae bacterium]